MYKISTEVAEKLKGTLMDDGVTFWNPIRDSKGQYWLPDNEVEQTKNKDLEKVKDDSKNKFDKSEFEKDKIDKTVSI